MKPRQAPQPKIPVVYIAGRYRAATEWDVYCNIHHARTLGMEVARLGGCPLIPQSNTAFMGGPVPDQFWLDATLELLRRADAVMLVWNWQGSEGAKLEVAEAKRLGIPVFEKTHELDDWLQFRRKLAEV